ncbi:phosphatase PAP2 family protein [Solobacterium moorei]|uniref:phosphatase PAP2 family protein n=1 Tax=Solobacterium moorei TaxID=102148 RepID=UPI0024AE7DB8|nr:phosphatase PAP2 family protein [Solobacterium moorei]MDI6413886.1 phosphatase PAP2 family protein [Solobacterium moorei]
MQVFQKKNIKWVIVLICISIFVYLMQAVWGSRVLPIDTSGYGFMSKHFISNSLTPVMRLITQFGGTILMIAWAMASLVLIKNKRIAISVVSNLVLIALLNNILKLIVRRARPTGFRLIAETGYSFPSGHSMVSMAFYGYLIYLIYKNVRNKKLRWTLIACFSLLILIIGMSRIYLGVHYTSDVFAGFLFSLGYLVIYTKLTDPIVFLNK